MTQLLCRLEVRLMATLLKTPPIQLGISETSPDGLDLICSALLHPILPSCVLNIFRSLLWCDCSCRHRATSSGSDFAFASSKSSELPLTALCRLLCLYSASADELKCLKAAHCFTPRYHSPSLFTPGQMKWIHCIVEQMTEALYRLTSSAWWLTINQAMFCLLNQ